MYTIKLFSLLAMIGIMNTTNTINTSNVNDSDYQAYYYAYAVDYNTNKLYVTQVLYKEYDLGCTFTDEAISVQFHDYLEAEYNGLFTECKGSTFTVYDNRKESTKANATEYIRKIMKRYDKIIRIRDFEFLCD